MKGDFTRDTFNRRDRFNRVLMQQGRVMMDADWNEQQAIDAHIDRTGAIDVIGRCGAPMDDAGFEISQQGGKLFIGAGRYYADGLLCENDGDAGKPISYDAQPDLHNPPDPLTDLKTTGFAIAYLDVWERHITALDTPRLREVALNGPDTMTRVKTVWQVRLLPVVFEPKDKDDGSPCDRDFPEWDDLSASPQRKMTASTAPVAPNTDPCIVPPGAGYRGLENQLYRIEIHKAGGIGQATFKWSRDNGTVVSLIEKISGKEVTVSDLGRDDTLTFKPGDWVEVSDDALELNGLAGKLYQVDSIKAATRVVVLKSTPTKLNPGAASGVNAALKPKLRKWDQQAGANDQGVSISAADVLLEDGVQVRFDAAGETFKTGDYWLVPARVNTGDIEWPRDDTPQRAYLPRRPLGIRHHYCRLAWLALNEASGALTIDDCRNLFPPLTKVCARPKAMHVVAINWENDGPPPKNLEEKGLRIRLDTPPDPASISGDSVIVGAEIPFFIGNKPSPLLTQIVHVAGDVGVDPEDPRTIVWKPGRQTERAFAFVSVSADAEADRDPLIRRLHVTLKGARIWNADSTNKNRIHLDGQALGLPGQDTHAERAATRLSLPSGCCACASDFESWMTRERERKTDALHIVEIRAIGRSPASAPAGVIGSAKFPPAPGQAPSIVVNTGSVLIGFEVVFSRPVTEEGLKAASTDLQSLGAQTLAATPQRLPGDCKLENPTTASFTFKTLQRKTGLYQLVALGVDGFQPFGGPAVRAADDQSALDGQFDDTPGGNFVLQYEIRQEA